MSRAALAVAALLGATSWFVLGATRGSGEAWDNPQYFVALLPIVLVTSLAAGFVAPRSGWRCAYSFFAGQAIAAIARNPTGGLLPLGLILFFALATVCALPALAAGSARRWFAGRAGHRAR